MSEVPFMVIFINKLVAYANRTIFARNLNLLHSQSCILLNNRCSEGNIDFFSFTVFTLQHSYIQTVQLNLRLIFLILLSFFQREFNTKRVVYVVKVRNFKLQ